MIKHLRRHEDFNFYLASKLVTALGTLCITGLVSRSLGPEAFGFLMSASVIALILAAILDGNMTARCISQWHNDQPGFPAWLTHAIVLRVAIGALCSVLLLSICLLKKGDPYLVFAAGWCLLLVFQPFRMLEVRLIASEDFKLLARASLWSCLAILLLAAVLFSAGWTKRTWVCLGLLLLPVLGSSPYLVFVKKHLKRTATPIRGGSLRQEAAITFSFGTTQGLSMLMDSIPYLVIPRLYGQLTMGWYAAASKLIQTYTQGIALLIPYVLTKLSRDRKGRAINYCLFSLMLGLVCFFGFILFGTQAIGVINGAAFRKAGTLLLPLAGLIISIPLGQLCMGMAGITSKPRLPFLTVSTTFLLLGLFYVLFQPATVHGFLAAYSISILATTVWLSFLLFGGRPRGEG